MHSVSQRIAEIRLSIIYDLTRLTLRASVFAFQDHPPNSGEFDSSHLTLTQMSCESTRGDFLESPVGLRNHSLRKQVFSAFSLGYCQIEPYP